MPRWIPKPDWAGADAYIIGGGPSLAGFDFSQLRNRHTIGINDAFRLGVSVCKICFFSDEEWFSRSEQALLMYRGRVVSHCDHASVLNADRVDTMPRVMDRLNEDHSGLAFCGSSGPGAVNLALLLGAKRVMLLGFDCTKSRTGETHWHHHNVEPPANDIYPKFIAGWREVAKSLPERFPGREIINLNPNSAIDCFPKHDPKDFLYEPDTLNQLPRSQPDERPWVDLGAE